MQDDNALYHLEQEVLAWGSQFQDDKNFPHKEGGNKYYLGEEMPMPEEELAGFKMIKRLSPWRITQRPVLPQGDIYSPHVGTRNSYHLGSSTTGRE